MQAILQYKEDLFSGTPLSNPIIKIEACGDFWKVMHESAQFLAEEMQRYARHHGRDTSPYTVKMTPDWRRYSVKIRISNFYMECEYAQRLIEFIRTKAQGKY